MVGIGLQVYSNSAVYYSIISSEGGALSFNDISYLAIPVSLNKPEENGDAWGPLKIQARRQSRQTLGPSGISRSGHCG